MKGRTIVSPSSGRARRIALLLATLGCAWVGTVSPSSGASSITVVTSSLPLTPSPTDYGAGYVEDTAPGGIEVQVTTDNAAGVVLYIRCDDASPEVALSDILVKSGTAGSLMGSYAPITGSDQALWSAAGPVTSWSVYTDVRVQNLWVYPDAGGGGTTLYMDTFTYTVVEP